MSKPTGQIGTPSIIGGLGRRSWQILFLWLLASIPVTFLIYTIVEPTFEAFSLLQVEPTSPQLFGPLHGAQDLAQPYVQTQVKLMTSDKVLDAAISADPRVANLPMIRQSKDPKVDLRKSLIVEIVDNNTYLIRVALASTDPEEAAAIVNAVVTSYLDQHGEYHRTANKTLHTMLTNEIKKLADEIEATKTELQVLVRDGHVEWTKKVNPNAKKDDDPGNDPSLDTVTQEQYTMLADRLIQADLNLIDAQARLEAARATGQGVEKLRDLEAAVGEAKKRRTGYAGYMETVHVFKPVPKSDTFKATILKKELDSRLKMQDIVTRKLEQLNFEDRQDVYRISLHDKAAVPRAPANNLRLKLMAEAPLVILMLIVVWFLLIEIRAVRIAAHNEGSYLREI